MNRDSIYLASGAKLAPKGRIRIAQGVSPGDKYIYNGSAEGAKQSASILKRWLTMNMYLELKQSLSAPPFQGFRISGP